MGINNVGGVSGLAQAGGTQGADSSQSTSMGKVSDVNQMSTADFSAKMATASNQDMAKLLGTPGLSEARKSEVANELLKRIEAEKAAASNCSGAAPSGQASAEETDDEKKIKELLKKLKDGKISSAEMKELTGLMAKDKSSQDTTPGGAGKTALTV